ncbi:MAG: isochorismatase family cysteine hydrolase [Candidatus Caldarchaeum sp.]
MLSMASGVPPPVPKEWKIPEPARVQVNPKKDLLVVVDLQREYCEPKGRKYLETTREILPSVLNVLESFRSRRAKVAFTLIGFNPGDPRFSGIQSRTYPRKGDWGYELLDELKATPGDIIVEKNCYDPFLSSNMESLLTANGVLPSLSAVVVVGAVTTTCVYHTVSGLFHRGYRVAVPVDCVADRTPAAQLFGLWKFATLYGVTLTRSDLLEFVE